MPNFLTRKLGPFPTWVYIVVVVIGGVVFYLWWRNYTNSNSSSSANAAATNPLNPNNDPNIDPNTGVPYALEEMIDPNTGEPYYYSNMNQPPAPTPKPTPSPTPPPKPKPKPKPCPKGYSWDADHDKCVKDKSSNTSVPGQFGQLGPPVSTQMKTGTGTEGSGPSGGPGSTYVFETVGNTGQTAHLSAVAIQQYGVHSQSDVNAAVNHMVNANPALKGRNGTYQPPAGTKIVIPER